RARFAALSGRRTGRGGPTVTALPAQEVRRQTSQGLDRWFFARIGVACLVGGFCCVRMESDPGRASRGRADGGSPSRERPGRERRTSGPGNVAATTARNGVARGGTTVRQRAPGQRAGSRHYQPGKGTAGGGRRANWSGANEGRWRLGHEGAQGR